MRHPWHRMTVLEVFLFLESILKVEYKYTHNALSQSLEFTKSMYILADTYTMALSIIHTEHSPHFFASAFPCAFFSNLSTSSSMRLKLQL